MDRECETDHGGSSVDTVFSVDTIHSLHAVQLSVSGGFGFQSQGTAEMNGWLIDGSGITRTGGSRDMDIYRWLEQDLHFLSYSV